MKRFKSPAHVQRFTSIHDPISNLFNLHRFEISSQTFRQLRADAMQQWNEITGLKTA